MTSTKSSRKVRKRSPFRRVFRWQCQYNRLLSLFYTAGLLAAIPGTLLLELISTSSEYSTLTNWPECTAEEVATLYGQAMMQSFDFALTTFVMPLCAVYILCFCFRAFGFMHTRRSTDLFHSLPIRRTPMLMGTYAAGLFTLLLPLAVSVGLAQALFLYYQVPSPMTSLFLWQGCGVTALLVTASLTMTMFFLVVSGTLVSALISLVSVLAGWPIAVALVDSTMELFLPGYLSVIPGTAYTALCPFGAIYSVIPGGLFAPLRFLTGMRSGSVGYDIPLYFLLWWAGVTLCLLLASLFYYSRRKSEHAENAFSFPLARGAVRFLLSLCGGLSLGIILGTVLDSNTVYFVSIAVGAFIVHLVYQVVMVRSFRRFWLTLPSYVLLLGCISGGLYLLYQGGLGYVQRVPDSSAVTLTEFSLPGLSGDDSKEAYLANTSGFSLQDVDNAWLAEVMPQFTTREGAAAIADLHRSVLERYPGPYLPFEHDCFGQSYVFNVTYTLSDGSQMSRLYTLPIYADSTSILESLAAVQHQEEYKAYQLYYSFQHGDISNLSVTEFHDKEGMNYDARIDSLSDEDAALLWKTFTEELDSPAFSAPNEDLLTEEEAIRTAAAIDAGLYEDDEDSETGRNYIIFMKDVPFDQLSPATRALCDEIIREEGLQDVRTASTYNPFYIPECCVKTREVMDTLTAPNATVY